MTMAGMSLDVLHLSCRLLAALIGLRMHMRVQGRSGTNRAENNDWRLCKKSFWCESELVRMVVMKLVSNYLSSNGMFLAVPRINLNLNQSESQSI